jgi:hypothetical protein
MGGLLVATVLTLIFLPALYVAWFRIEEPPARREASFAGTGVEPMSPDGAQS